MLLLPIGGGHRVTISFNKLLKMKFILMYSCTRQIFLADLCSYLLCKYQRIFCEDELKSNKLYFDNKKKKKVITVKSKEQLNFPKKRYKLIQLLGINIVEN